MIFFKKKLFSGKKGPTPMRQSRIRTRERYRMESHDQLFPFAAVHFKTFQFPLLYREQMELGRDSAFP